MSQGGINGNRSQSSTGIGPPTWDPKARAGIYLGHSSFHAGNVALVLNLQTGHVSLQYHVDFDDEFSTVPYLQSSEPPPNWIPSSEPHRMCYKGIIQHGVIMV
eukprot:13340828-Ditylum_brightwellii.AAC.1